ncbi:antitoxin [Myxosarcina sp. GI1]|uniref:antitoxin n=1 Tax=Myxosarcina sp. GI1 TaxID=1541065 RepID=UPI0005691F96|nr:antitoxin [Myxosarcina sp. GI1]
MNKLDLDGEEKEILESFERGEWQLVGDKTRLAQLRSYAKATLAKDKRITLRLSSFDLDAIQAKAIEEGIPYQTLISSILHKYATGLLVERQQEANQRNF